MPYRSEVYLKARAVLDERRKAAEKEQQKRRSEVLSVCPELDSIEREMASYGAEAIRLIGSQKNVDEEIKKLAEKSRAVQNARKSLLGNAGFPEDYLEIRYHCPVCKDTGSHDGYYCDCYKKLVVETARKELCSLSVLDASGFDRFDLGLFSDKVDPQLGISPREQMQGVYEFCREYARDFSLRSEGIFMFGKTGLGKTHLSLAIADEVTKKGFNVLYTTAQQALSKLEREHFRREEAQTDLLDELCNADLLVLDDLGAEFSTSFTVSVIYNIINTRIIDGLPTIISTNLTLEEIEAKYSQRVSSRLLGNFKMIRFIGNDIRMEKLR